ncbi:hypothetical protein MGYG_09128 [Nannizzia gypsea CBS 118893]|uniref:Uncharacterized protein n=1 Tax=Arthroderma gypseum (strain ATCC MYA-4604 / CBS 118893) TaxID=535722 RepID=E4UZK4_ARTGP|nr:hypothetical protein MGYG_09128 [Nannizzia gypsea CBS 118893]EFR03534.1 hypothetical protein MGYG_09128 [Nannizzia gypsea CBS 118893]
MGGKRNIPAQSRNLRAHGQDQLRDRLIAQILLVTSQGVEGLATRRVKGPRRQVWGRKRREKEGRSRRGLRQANRQPVRPFDCVIPSLSLDFARSLYLDTLHEAREDGSTAYQLSPRLLPS